MVGLLQIMIYLLCVYLVYKGVEIFQIAFVSDSENVSRKLGVVIGIIMIIGAVVVGVGAVFMTESLVADIGNKMNNIPKFP